MKNIAIIFAGGTGARMGAGLPKQFLQVNGKPIIMYVLEVFDEHPTIDEIYVACKKEYIGELERLIRKYGLAKVVKVVPGGTSGQDSIYQALSAAKENNEDNAIVLIHDGVRPLIPHDLIDSVIESVHEYGSGVTCSHMTETPIMSLDGEVVESVLPREKLYFAQAPQGFYLDEVVEAHEKMRKENPDYSGIVDTCSLMMYYGKDCHLVEGPTGNIKVTTPEDLYSFKAFVDYRETTQNFGFSRDDVRSKLNK